MLTSEDEILEYDRNSKTTVAIIGAGSGGQAMAAHLALKGYVVNLFNRSENVIDDINSTGGRIKLIGDIVGIGILNMATSDINKAVDGASVIMITVPASAHADIAKMCAPYLFDDQIIVLNPGRTGGALEFTHTIRSAGSTADVIVAETQTIIYTARCVRNGEVHIIAVKRKVPVAVFPSSRLMPVMEILGQIYTQYLAVNSVLDTGLNNVGAILHPTPTLLSASWVESPRTQFKYYYEAITPTVAGFLEVIDQERVRVAEAFGVQAVSVKDWLKEAYGVHGNTLHEAIHNNEKYSNIDAPETLHHRYIFEDIPTGLVPIASLGDLAGVSTPYMKLVILLASKLLGVDFWETGRTVERLGLESLSIDEIRYLVMNGNGE